MVRKAREAGQANAQVTRILMQKNTPPAGNLSECDADTHFGEGRYVIRTLIRLILTHGGLHWWSLYQTASEIRGLRDKTSSAG